MFAIQPTNKMKWIFSFIIPLFLVSCKVMLIGAYDQVTDQSIQKIQTDVSTIIVKIERNIDNGEGEANKYALFKDNYETMAGEIETLKIRCNSMPKYKIVLEQVKLLEANLGILEKLHKIGFKQKQELAPIKSGFESQFSAMITLQNALKREKNK